MTSRVSRGKACMYIVMIRCAAIQGFYRQSYRDSYATMQGLYRWDYRDLCAKHGQARTIGFWRPLLGWVELCVRREDCQTLHVHTRAGTCLCGVTFGLRDAPECALILSWNAGDQCTRRPMIIARSVGN